MKFKHRYTTSLERHFQRTSTYLSRTFSRQKRFLKNIDREYIINLFNEYFQKYFEFYFTPKGLILERRLQPVLA